MNTASAVASTSAEDQTRLPDGQLMAERDAPVGGQAVLEGVMMRGVSTWAVAVRLPLPEEIAEGELDPQKGAHGEIDIQTFPFESVLKRRRWLRLPLIRGVVALVESMKIGFKALEIAANAQLPPDEQGERDEIGKGTWAGTVTLALALAVGLFFLLPVGLTSLIGRDRLGSSIAFVVVEKLIRITIFLGYLTLLSRLADLRRVFEYHGAEHKTIACYEAGLPLTPENAARFSRLHPRCGTSFLLIVMVVAIFVFAPLGTPAWYWLFLSRIVGIPIVAGIAFEAIKWFGRNRNRRWARALMWPGLQLQRLTTREPDHAQLAVAIAALEAVLAVEDPLAATPEERAGMEVAA